MSVLQPKTNDKSVEPRAVVDRIARASGTARSACSNG